MAPPRIENPQPHTVYMREWRKKNPRYNSEYQPRYRRQQRERVIAHYGGACACCGEDRFEFLALDHIGGGGTKERRESGDRGSRIVARLIRENFPPGFRILCHNCNQAIGFYGCCPHENAYKAEAG